MGASLRGIKNAADLPPGSPRLVLSVGRRSPPVARWIKARSGGATQLVHFGRPWAPCRWFDLIVTTAQYRLPESPNIVCNSFPFLVPSTDVPIPSSLRDELDQLPRPWTVILAGGSSRPYVFDREAAAALAEAGNEAARSDGGSLLFVRSPRTSRECVEIITPLLRAPAFIYDQARHENPYRALLHAADCFIVTSDSALMVAEVLVSSKPLQLFALQRKPDWRYRVASAWNGLAQRSRLASAVFSLLRDIGFITSTRELDDYYQRLRVAGAFDSVDVSALLSATERDATLARITEVMQRSGVAREGSQ